MFLLMEMYELVSRQCRATGLKSRQINYYQFLAKQQQQKQQQTMYSLNRVGTLYIHYIDHIYLCL